MRKLELLSPAKNLECGIAAIDHGADAVYIGAQRFGARAAVGNSIEDIRTLCQYAHRFDAKVYVTVNTIVYDEELADTRSLLEQLAEAKVDAILVQDMGVMQMAQELGLTVHASTQTDNRKADKVRWLSSLGCARVVLARELSADEIAAIHAEVPDTELEVFVHGALCVSYSGLCYASQYCFGRSANRGACAQFCRMKFDLLDADGQEIDRQRYFLSLKDMNQSQHLGELIEAGAVSFKIEGRLKDINYVKNVTAAYSELLNAYIKHHPEAYERASKGRCTYTFKPDLRKTFNRGYTNYFLHGRQPDIASFDTPKAMGEFVGTVKELRGNSFNVAGVASFSNGDGLCFVNSNRELEGFRVNRVEGNRLFPLKMPAGLRPGLRLYRNNDQEMERLLSKPSAERKIPVKMSIRATEKGFSLQMGEVVATIEAEHQEAQKDPRENIIRQLTKLGGTSYTCTEVDIPADFNYFIPSSLLSELRRQVVSLAENNVFLGRKQRFPAEKTKVSLEDTYRNGYLYNVSNRLARLFYEQKGIAVSDAYELRPQKGPVMQCRHCLRYALGFCVKNGGHKPEWKEPLSLRLGDGRTFRLEFDCQHCQMNIYANE
ncbi:U32 family peptidase [Prevotella sp. E2-28]|uniref:peptidase U32 family protein n=1 Tax=Prevotella sp. E2-28 TaxID=2913620 RepID=UPI001EDA47FC|nr:U32 family peptidase [Prevotella sp. E2-28]UKK54903.1 U32 family peptidase [Prevotella sp. E2-28]